MVKADKEIFLEQRTERWFPLGILGCAKILVAGFWFLANLELEVVFFLSFLFGSFFVIFSIFFLLLVFLSLFLEAAK